MTTTKQKPQTTAATPGTPWSSTLARLKARSRPVATLTICDNPQVKQALTEARHEHVRATAYAAGATTDKEAAQRDLAAAAEQLEAAQAAYAAEAIVLRFQALERDAFQELLDAHKPTEAQAEEGYDFNRDTLAPVLLAECSLDGMTTEDAEHFLNTWASAESQALANTVFGVQGELRMDLGKG